MNKLNQQLIIEYPGQPTYIFEESMLYVEGNQYQLSSMQIIFDKNDSNISFQIYGQWNQLDKLFENLKKYCFQQNMRDHYEIKKLVGQGSFGKVYQAIHKPSSKKYAIKQIDKQILNKNNSFLLLEIDILRRLNHETCIHIHEQFMDDQYIYLVLDYVNGGDLLDYLNQQSEYVNENTVRDIMRILFEALEYIHQKGIVHRDLKPENILMRNKSCMDLVISDFGLADVCLNGFLTQRCGTLGFIAPEILRGKSYDYKVDVFSLGVILFVILLGEYPFDDGDSKELLLKNQQAIIDFKSPKLNQLSHLGLDFLKSCLQADPKDRLSAKEAIKHPWLSKKSIDSRFIIDSSKQLRSIKSQMQVKVKEQIKFDSQNFINSLQVLDYEDDAEIKPCQVMNQYIMKVHFRNVQQ